MSYVQSDQLGKIFKDIWNKIKQISLKKWIWKCLQNGSNLFRAWGVLVEWDISACRSWKMDEKNTHTNNLLNLFAVDVDGIRWTPQLRSSKFMVWMSKYKIL